MISYASLSSTLFKKLNAEKTESWENRPQSFDNETYVYMHCMNIPYF